MREIRIRADELAAAVRGVLDQYEGDARAALGRAVRSTTRGAARRLRQGSPKRTGTYAKGWTSKVAEDRSGTEGIVYDETGGRLTHLLEHGHAKRDGGRVQGRPHIAPVNDWARTDVVERLEKELRGP